jgi:hypothetical protein
LQQGSFYKAQNIRILSPGLFENDATATPELTQHSATRRRRCPAALLLQDWLALLTDSGFLSILRFDAACTRWAHLDFSTSAAAHQTMLAA